MAKKAPAVWTNDIVGPGPAETEPAAVVVTAATPEEPPPAPPVPDISLAPIDEVTLAQQMALMQPPKPTEVRYRDPAFAPTAREEMLEELARKTRMVAPNYYHLRSTMEKAPRVVHDHYGNKVLIEPLKAKFNVLLLPKTAEYLKRTGLEVEEAKTAA
jgi:hypothetical protein